MQRLFFTSFIVFFVFLVPLFFVNTQYIYARALSEEAAVYREKGYNAQGVGDIDGAISWYQKATSLDPAYAAPHNDLGILFEAKGWLDRAEKEYQKAIAIDPNYEKSHTNLALLYERKGELEKAAFHWMRRYKLGDPNAPWTYEARQRLEKLGLLDRAEREKPKAMPEKPTREIEKPVKKSIAEKQTDKSKASEWTRIDYRSKDKAKKTREAKKLKEAERKAKKTREAKKLKEAERKAKKTREAKKLKEAERTAKRKTKPATSRKVGKRDLDRGLQESLRLAEEMLREGKAKEVGTTRTKAKESSAREVRREKISDTGAGSYYAKARNYYERGEYSRALDAIRSAKEGYPDDPSLFKLEQTVKNKMKEERIQDHYNEGIMRYHQQDFSGARKEFEAILNILPE